MTTPSVLPQKLWRPLAEIKNFVEKMPDGVRLTEVTKKLRRLPNCQEKRETSSSILSINGKASLYLRSEKKVLVTE